DPDFAKAQLILLLREWYMHPNGQLPAYEWALGDVNPPVHAWAALRVYRIERRLRRQGDRAFLERVFHKLLLNFTWFANRDEPEVVDKLKGFTRRMQWFVDNHPEFREHVAMAAKPGVGLRRLLAIVSREQLPSVLGSMLDEAEFLSPHGIRAVSRRHRAEPYVLTLNGVEHRVEYEPAESTSGLFGGNSNWRGPVWFPVNYLLIESLQKFHHFYGDGMKVPCPTGSGRLLNLWQVAAEV